MKIDSNSFDTYLEAEVAKLSAGQILSYGDVRTCLAEHLNNAVIKAWELDNPLPSLEKQFEPLLPEWEKLVASLIPQIHDDMRATSDPDDDAPGMQLTIGFTPETRERNASWNYQTGDNSYSGGAYSHPHWAVIYLSRESKPGEVASEIADQIAELVN